MNTKQTRAGRDEEAGRAESNTDVDVTEDGNHIALQFLIVPDIAACLSFTRKYFESESENEMEKRTAKRKRREVDSL